MSLKQLYPLHLFIFHCYGKGLGGSSGEDGGRFNYENVMSTPLIFLSGVAQRETEGSFIRKKLYPLHLFFSDFYG